MNLVVELSVVRRCFRENLICVFASRGCKCCIDICDRSERVFSDSVLNLGGNRIVRIRGMEIRFAPLNKYELLLELVQESNAE